MKIVFMGTPEFACPILEALASKYEVVLVVSQPNKPEGRKGIIKDTPVAAKAKELGLNVFQPVRIKDEIEYFLNLDADVLVTAAYGQFVPTKILKHFKKCLNVHGSLLPRHRGGAPIQRSIIEGDTHTGVTIMEMVKKMDAGQMFAKKSIEITDLDNNSTMFEKLSIIGRDLLMENIEGIVSGEIIGQPQNELEATISPNIDVSEEKIDFNKSARSVFNLIRGLSLNPGAYAQINGFRIKVYESKIVSDDSDKLPGTVLVARKRLVIKCGTDAIEFVTIKPEGKKVMRASDFLNGQKNFTLDDVFN